MHRSSVNVQKVLEDGPPTKEPLLTRQNPGGKYGLPGISRRAGDISIVSVDNVERSGIMKVEGRDAVRSNGV